MGKSKYAVPLTADQTASLEAIIHRGKSTAATIRHAYILLYVSTKTDAEIAGIVRCHS